MCMQYFLRDMAKGLKRNAPNFL